MITVAKRIKGRGRITPNYRVLSMHTQRGTEIRILVKHPDMVAVGERTVFASAYG